MILHHEVLTREWSSESNLSIRWIDSFRQVQSIYSDWSRAGGMHGNRPATGMRAFREAPRGYMIVDGKSSYDNRPNPCPFRFPTSTLIKSSADPANRLTYLGLRSQTNSWALNDGDGGGRRRKRKIRKSAFTGLRRSLDGCTWKLHDPTKHSPLLPGSPQEPLGAQSPRSTSPSLE